MIFFFQGALVFIHLLAVYIPDWFCPWSQALSVLLRTVSTGGVIWHVYGLLWACPAARRPELLYHPLSTTIYRKIDTFFAKFLFANFETTAQSDILITTFYLQIENFTKYKIVTVTRFFSTSQKTSMSVYFPVLPERTSLCRPPWRCCRLPLQSAIWRPCSPPPPFTHTPHTVCDHGRLQPPLLDFSEPRNRRLFR